MQRTLLAMVFVTAFAGCLVVSADVPQICTTQTVQLAGFPIGAAPPASTTFTRELTLPATSTDLVTHLSFAGGTLSAADNDLTFLAAIKIELEPPDAATQPVTLLDYRRSASVPRTIDLPATSRELAAFLVAGGARLRLTATGQPPQAGATLGIELCVDAGVDKTISLTP